MLEPVEAGSLADGLLNALRAQKDQGHYPLTLRRLAELADPSAAEKAVLKATHEEPFTSAAVVAQKKNLNAPVALRDDLPTLAASPLLLEFVLEQVCTPKKPLCPLDKATKKLDDELRPAFTEAVGRLAQEGRLPEAVGALADKKGLLLYLKRMPPPRPMVEQIAGRLLATLNAQGRPGSPEFPLTVKRLLELTEVHSAGTNTKRALASPAFTDGVVVAVKKDPDSPVALRQDVDALAASPRLLDFVLHRVCSEERPVCPLDRVTARLDLDVRGAFTETVARQLEEQSLPPDVGTLTLKGGPALYLKKWAPKPPPEAPEAALSRKLVEALEAQRNHGGPAYPLTLSMLARAAGADPEADAGRIRKAVTKEPFAGRAVLALPKSPDSPVALAEDADRLAVSAVLLETLLATSRSADSFAQPLPELVKRLPGALQEPFEAAVQTGALPATVGSVVFKGRVLLFLKEDLGRMPEPDRDTAGDEGLASAPPEFADEAQTSFGGEDRNPGTTEDAGP